MPPISRPTSTSGLSTLNTTAWPSSSWSSILKAANSTSAASAAEPIAYPLVTALVVLPTASSGSVMSRTSCGHVGHLGDAAGVVGDRAERVERDDQAGQRQLSHHRDADAVDAGQVVREQDAADDHQRGQRGGLQALREALDDVRRVAGLGRAGGLLDRAEAGRRVVVGDDEQRRRHGEADQRAEVDVPGARSATEVQVGVREVVHHPLRDRDEQQRGDDARHDHALVERALDVAGRGAHRERADDRRDDRDAAEHEREQHDLGRRRRPRRSGRRAA